MAVPVATELRRRLKAGEQSGHLPVETQYSYYEGQYQAIRSAMGDKFDVAGKTVLETGPGDSACLGLFFLRDGARHVRLVDRFPAFRFSERGFAVYKHFLERNAERKRELTGVIDFSRREFDPARLSYRLEAIDRPSSEPFAADFVYSVDVLEHVRSVRRTFGRLAAMTKPGGLQFHRVDLSGHGAFERPRHDLEFLVFPDWLWSLMGSHRGVPNRARFSEYQETAALAGLEVIGERIVRLSKAEVASVRDRLAKRFRDLGDDELGVVEFDWVLRKP